MALIGRPDVWEIFTLEPSAIIVPEDYGRSDVGDLTELAASIDRFGTFGFLSGAVLTCPVSR